MSRSEMGDYKIQVSICYINWAQAGSFADILGPKYIFTSTIRILLILEILHELNILRHHYLKDPNPKH